MLKKRNPGTQAQSNGMVETRKRNMVATKNHNMTNVFFRILHVALSSCFPLLALVLGLSSLSFSRSSSLTAVLVGCAFLRKSMKGSRRYDGDLMKISRRRNRLLPSLATVCGFSHHGTNMPRDVRTRSISDNQCLDFRKIIVSISCPMEEGFTLDILRAEAISLVLL